MSTGRYFFVALGLMSICPLAQPQTQITPDTSLGTTVSQNGSTHTIAGGTTIGGQNLFHSFSQFDLLDGDTASFAGTGLLNIISRISGGPSTIDGTIQGPAGGTNLWIINPNGVMFGANSTLDVSGSFHISTADYLLLENGGQFFANPNQNSVLTVGNPTTFGFLNTPTGNIDIESTDSLQVPDGQAMSFVASEVFIQDFATLRAPGGRINIASVGSVGAGGNGEITLAPDDLIVTGVAYSAASPERVWVDLGSEIDVSGEGGGSIFIRGGSFLLGDQADGDGGRLIATTQGSTDGGIIDIEVAQNVRANGLIIANTDGSGASGDIRIDAREIGIVHNGTGTLIESRSVSGLGDAGSVSLRADTTINLDAPISVQATGTANAGDISLVASTINIDAQGSITSATSDSGAGGDITIAAVGDVFIQDGTITARTSGAGDAGDIRVSGDFIHNSQHITIDSSTAGAGPSAGNGGDITLQATSQIELTAGDITSSTSSTGAGGRISLIAPRIILTEPGDQTFDGISISSNTTGAGDGGLITIQGDQVDITQTASLSAGASATSTGAAGGITVTATDSVMVDAMAGITTSTAGEGAAGNISIDGGNSLRVQGDAQISSESSNATSGSAGRIGLRAVQVTIGQCPADFCSNQISVTTASDRIGNTPGEISVTGTQSILITNDDLGDPILIAGTTGSNEGGRILIDAPAVRIDGANMLSTTSGAGDAGGIEINGTGTLDVFGSIIEAGTSGAGQGGSIILRGANITADGGTDLLANTFATARAGNIDISGDDVQILSASIEATAGTDGVGGNIALGATSQLRIASTANIEASTQGTGRGGDITLDAAVLNVTDDANISVSTSGIGPDAGAGGTVTIQATDALIDGRATVSGQTNGDGIGGSIQVLAGNLAVAGNGRLLATTLGAGDGGSIDIDAASLVVEGSGSIFGNTSGNGTGGTVDINAADLVVHEDGVVSVSTEGPGAGGSVIVTGNTLTVAGNGEILASTSSTGNGGSVDIDTVDVVVEGSGSISGNTTGAGTGGTVDVNADNLLLQENGSISANTDGPGAGGSIFIQGAEMTVSGQGNVSATTCTTASGCAGAGGDIVISGRLLTVVDEGRIEASTRGEGKGGSITVISDDLVLGPGGLVAVNANGTGDAGAISIDVTGSIFLDNARIQSASMLSNGGNVEISAGDFIFFTDSEITTSANAMSGNAGNIRIGTDQEPAAPAFLIFQGADISADAGASGGAINVHAQYILGSEYEFSAISDTGNDGEITIDVPATDFVSVISQLDLPILNIAELLNDQCVVSALSERSSFVVDTVGLPPSPEAYKSSGYYLPGDSPTSSLRSLPETYAAIAVLRDGC